MRQERTIQPTIFEVFAQHEIGSELKAMSQWLEGQRQLTSLVAGDLRRLGVRETRLGQPDGISPSRMAEMLEVDKGRDRKCGAKLW